MQTGSVHNQGGYGSNWIDMPSPTDPWAKGWRSYAGDAHGLAIWYVHGVHYYYDDLYISWDIRSLNTATSPSGRNRNQEIIVMKFKTIFSCITFVIFFVNMQANAQPVGLQNPFSPVSAPERSKLGSVEAVPISAMSTVKDAQLFVLQNREQQISKGWVEVNEERARVVDDYVSNARNKLNADMNAVRESIHIVPADVSGTTLEQAHFVGAFAAGGFVDQLWTGVVRVYESSDLGRVILEEYDYKRVGSYITIPSELVESYVNGYPVLYSVLRGGDVHSHTDITWFTDRKQFRMRTGKAISKSDNRYRTVEQIINSFD